jgi:hypothetical protein
VTLIVRYNFKFRNSQEENISQKWGEVFGTVPQENKTRHVTTIRQQTKTFRGVACCSDILEHPKVS